MSDKKTNDFWKSSDDDFWNKPVITGDWLNNDSSQTENTEQQNPYAEQQNPYVEQQSVYAETQNDYFEMQSPYEGMEKPVYGIPNQPAYTYQRKEKAKSKKRWHKEQDTNQKKTFPIFAVINLFFLGAALCVLAASIFGARHFQSKADLRNRQLDYERVTVEEDCFQMYDNNTVILAWDACIILSQDTEKQLLGMPSGEMLIAVPVQVESEEYKLGQYALRDSFIGCDMGEQRIFRRCVRDDTIFAVLGVMGFNQEEIFSSYGLGNGNDESGFFFFFVPEKTREITFYAEERKEEQGISILERRYEKKLMISDSMDGAKLLAEIRGSEEWQ